VAEKNIEKILNKDSKNLLVNYYGIEAIVLKNEVFKLKLLGKYPLVGNKCPFIFQKKQYNVESFFIIIL